MNDYEEEAKRWKDFVNLGYFTSQSGTFNFYNRNFIEKSGIKGKKKMLEIGCGYGKETRRFDTFVKEVYVADVSETALKLCKKNVPSVKIVDINEDRIDAKSNFFDVVYSCYVLQHIPRKSLSKLIKEVHRVLKLGGLFVFEMFGGSNVSENGEDVRGWSVNQVWREFIVNGYTPVQVKKLVKDFKVKFTETVDFSSPIAGVSLNHWFCCEKK